MTDVRDAMKVEPASARPGAVAVDDSELPRRVAQHIATQIAGAKAGDDWCRQQPRGGSER